MNTAILWFRRDLRIKDNPAIQWVCKHCDSVLPVYIHSPEEEQPWIPGGASRWWLHHSLQSLADSLAGFGLKLHFFSGSSDEILQKIITQTGANYLVFNKLYEQHLYQRDQRLAGKLHNRIKLVSCDSGLLFTPGTILNTQRQPYRVFTPFYRMLRPLLMAACSNQALKHSAEAIKALQAVSLNPAESLQSLCLLDKNQWHDKLGHWWRPGEDEAHRLLDIFVENSLAHYQTQRDIPSKDASSRLSPYLHFGEITPQQICLELWPWLEGGFGENSAQSAEVFVKQLLWREFAYHVLWHFPETSSSPMDRRYHSDFWRTDEDDLLSWTRGETGFPIIDAGMKQLWETGWMHNRVRMIASSFLTKNLGINWLDGARWFWDTLVDADLANNSLGWQWVSGCGVDAAPYYRVFNPNTQTRRFDNDLKYIGKWLPQYNSPAYPQPIVDLAFSREQALHRYKQTIQQPSE